jgi:hypothetical protein
VVPSLQALRRNGTEAEQTRQAEQSSETGDDLPEVSDNIEQQNN